MTFNSFLRFFSLADENKLFPKNGNLPAEPYADLPVVAGDHIRVLLPTSDAMGYQPDRLDIRLGSPTGPIIGILRKQTAEFYSEIRLRVNSAPKPDDYRQFSLVADLPNPEYKPRILSLGALVEASSSAEGEQWVAGHLTDGISTSMPDNMGWSSNNNLTVDHEEYCLLTLDEESIIERIDLHPRADLPGYGFPIDFSIETSLDGVNYDRQVLVTNYSRPTSATPQAFELDPVSAKYVKIRCTRLPNDIPGDPNYRVQFTEISVFGTPVSQPKTIETPVLDTFRGQQTTLADYINAIREHYEQYPYTPVEVEQNGNELILRAYHSNGFALGNLAVTTGIGNVLEYNSNNPAITAQKGQPITRPAQDSYSVTCSEDIEAGNLFSLNGINYQAVGGEKPADVLRALGVKDGKLSLAAGTPVGASAEPGTFRFVNTNRPKIEALFDHAQNGKDLYTIVIGADVQPGNVYQVSSSGQTTRTITAGVNDTKASIESFFNATSGRFTVPQGASIVPAVSTGSQAQVNSNRPALTLTDKRLIPAAELDQHTVYINSSIRPGNRFKIGSKTATAVDGDTVLSIAQKLGYPSHPIRISLPVGTLLIAYADKGPRYGAANIADVEVLSGSTHRTNLPLVCEVKLPFGLQPGRRALFLTDSASGQAVGQGNYLLVKANAVGTKVLRYADHGQAFGFQYVEPRLTQQIRLEIDLGAERLRQAENLSTTLDKRTIRGETEALATRTLTTRAMPESFHRALYAALKHQSVFVDNVAYRSEGEYSESVLEGRKRLKQATAELVETRKRLSNTDDYKPVVSDSDTIGYALIASIDGPDGLSVFLQTRNLDTANKTWPVRAGQSVASGVFNLMIRAGADILRVGVYVNDLLAFESTLEPERLNRIDEPLLLPASAKLTLRFIPVPDVPRINTYDNEPV